MSSGTKKTKNIENTTNEITRDVKTFVLKDVDQKSQKSTETIKTCTNNLLTTIHELMKQLVHGTMPILKDMVYPYLISLYKRFNDKSSDKSSDESPDESSEKSNSKKTPSSLTPEKYIKYTQFIPLVFEFYFMMFHIFMVRMWFMMNFACTALYMYDNLSESDTTNRVIPVEISEIRKFASFVIGSGVVMMCFFTTSVGFFTLPLMIYLINRTSKNIFGKGF